MSDEAKALQAFGQRDYQRCAQLVYAMFPRVTVLMMQVFLISIQRLDLKDEIADFIKTRLPRFAAFPLPHALVSLTLGLKQPAEVMSLVRSNEDAAEFYLYYGSRLLTLGRVEEARQIFQNCLRVPGQRAESLVADDQMRWSSQAPELVAGERRRMARGMNDTRQLMGERRPAEAVAAARALYDEVARMGTLSSRDQVAAIDNYAYALYQAGDLDGSLARCNESIAMIEQRRVAGAFDTSPAYSVRAFILWDQGKRDEAIACARHALAQRKLALGDRHREVVSSLVNLIKLCDGTGQHDVATSSALEGVEILAAQPGQADAEVEAQWTEIVRPLLRHGSAAAKEAARGKFIAWYEQSGRGAQAIVLWARLVDEARGAGSGRPSAPPDPAAARERELREHVEGLLREQKLPEALEAAIRLAALHRQTPTLDRMTRARAFGLLTVARMQTGDNAGAIADGQESLRCWQEAGPTPALAQMHEILARAYRDGGDLAGALPHLRSAVELTDALKLPEDARASAYSALGRGLLHLNKVGEAREWLQKSSELFRKAASPASLQRLETLNALAVSVMDENPAEGEKLLREALDALKGTAGMPPVMESMLRQNLAAALTKRGTPAHSAEALKVLDAMAQDTRTATGDGSDRINWLIMRGEAAWQGGNVQEAEASLRSALAMSSGLPRPKDEVHSRIMLGLARARAAAGDFTAAVELLLDAQPYRNRDSAQTMALATDLEWRRHYRIMQFELDLLLSAATRAAALPAALVARIWEFVVRRKTIGIDIMVLRRSAEVHSPAEQTLKERMRALRDEAAGMEMTGPARDDADRYLTTLYDLRGRIAALEEQLGGSAWMRERLAATLAADARALSARIGERTALVELVRHMSLDFTTRLGADENPLGEAYVAFVVDRSGAVRMAALGPAAPIENAVHAVRPVGHAGTLQVPAAATAPPSSATTLGDDPVTGLHRAIVAPVLALLREPTGRLIIAPDGELNGLPFAALMDQRGEYLLDRFAVSYVTCGRNLPGESRQAQTASKPLVIGDPDFDWTGTMPAASGSSRGSATQQGARTAILPGGAAFTRLLATGAEARSVAGRLGVSPLTGNAAMKSAVLDAHSPLVLHLATHGYFVPSAAPEGLPGARIESVIAIAAEDTVDGRLSLRIRNPLLRCGLALAGANAWLTYRPTPAEVGDGLLSAENVAAMDLQGTELVVLSACDTGLGDIRTGDGVLGLQRALAVAGARTVVMSLWKVPDAVTCMLIEHFYEQALAGQAVDAALGEAQRFIRTLTAREFLARWADDPGIVAAALTLRGSGDEEETSYPFVHEAFWGGFVCVGDMSPLPRRPGWAGSR